MNFVYQNQTTEIMNFVYDSAAAANGRQEET